VPAALEHALKLNFSRMNDSERKSLTAVKKLTATEQNQVGSESRAARPFPGSVLLAIVFILAHAELVVFDSSGEKHAGWAPIRSIKDR
jgi:hypothetical protein